MDAWLEKNNRVNDETVYLERVYEPTEFLEVVDVIPDHWLLMWADNSNQWAKVWRGGMWITAHGKIATFLPPFSVVKWGIDPGFHRMQILLSLSELPKRLRTTGPFCFPCNLPQLPHKRSDVVTLIESGLERAIPIGLETNVTALARRTKDLLDASFLQSTSVAQIANQLKVSHSVMTRAFAASYGMSPAAYRKRLRLFEAKKELLFGNPKVIDSAFHSGFRNLGFFNRQFKKEFRTVPSQIGVVKSQESASSV